ncbi:MAG TPA: cytochrome P450 [Polyangiaceae bacterium]|jgi:cytochrome P450|nr:cytochrome P450 [Polyangiaceae bacterium]
MQAATPPRLRGLPLVGSALRYLRGPLAFFEDAAKLGSIVDLQIPLIPSFHFSDPEDIEHAVVSAHRNFVKDLPLRDTRIALGDGLLTSEGDRWRRSRRAAQPAFHRDRIHAYGRQMIEATDRTLGVFRPGEVRDVHADLMRLTLDIVLRVLFSSDAREDAPLFRAAVDALMERYDRPVVPGVDLFPTRKRRRLRASIRGLDEAVGRIVARRRSGPSPSGDLLSMLLASRDDAGAPMPESQIRSEIKTMILAGHETTANALAWTLHLLSCTPAAESHLHGVIDAALGGRAPGTDDLPQLTRVEHAVSEGLRLYPPAWVIGREVREPFDLRGFHFPKRSQIYFSQWVIQRDGRYFEAPHAFRPERWADGLARRLPRFAYFPFGGGPRVCIGNTFAMTEATLLLARMMQRFRFAALPERPPVPMASLTLRPRGGLFMRVTPRARA